MVSAFRALSFLLLLCNFAAASDEFKWHKLEDGFYYANSIYGSGTETTEFFTFRINRLYFDMELHLTSFLLDEYLEFKRKNFTFNEIKEGRFKEDDYSLSNIWLTVKKDPNVLAVVPIGYTEIPGSPNLAGFIRLKGTKYNNLMSAPDLSAVLCIDDQIFRTAGETPYDGKAPTLFGVHFDRKQSYRYIDGFDLVEFGQTFDSENRVNSNEMPRRASFSGINCPDAVQVGPRIIEPHSYLQAEGNNRLGFARESLESKRAQHITILSYDLSGHVTFLTTEREAHPYHIARMLSDDWFYPQKCHWPNKRSKSCELWATGLTGYKHSGIIIRDFVNPDKVVEYGAGGREVPAVLVIRKRSPSGNPRTVQEGDTG